MDANFLWLQQAGQADIAAIGSKNVALAGMLQQLEGSDITVPHGFATTAHTFRDFMRANQLDDKIYSLLDSLDINDSSRLSQTVAQIHRWILAAPFAAEIAQELQQACRQLQAESGSQMSFTVHSSTTAEDRPTIAFAAQPETRLNIKGENELLDAIRTIYASLFNDRAIGYRVRQGFAHQQIAVCATVQKMPRSDNASSGLMVTLDTESGFRDVVFISASYGLGEMIVQERVEPDEFYLHKPLLKKGNPAILSRRLGSKQKKMIFSGENSSRIIEVEERARQRFSIDDEDIQQLSGQALIIEKHFQQPMEIEWARDAEDQRLYILQARPHVVKEHRADNIIRRYELQARGEVITSGRSIGQGIATGIARVITDMEDGEHLRDGEILITEMTDLEWEPLMQRAGAIVTRRGGRTCHAAITARERGIPALVGCADATNKIENGSELTISCAEGRAGYIYRGKLPFRLQEINPSSMPKPPVRIMLKIANPERAFDLQSLPNDGVGLAQIELIIKHNIGVHPRALLGYRRLAPEIQQQIDKRSCGYADPVSFYIEKLVEGIATIAAAFWPKPVIVRLSDFQSSEYRKLIGGETFEPREENPALGFRGASRYTDPDFQESFELECFAIKKVRDEMGLSNIAIMPPFVRTPEEAHNLINLLQENGLRRDTNNLNIIMSCEIPANALLAERYLKYFDGFTIDANDLTQLTLGLDRESERIAFLFDEHNEAVKSLISMAVSNCRRLNKYIGICTQAPADYPEFANWLIDQGISSMCLNPNNVIETWQYLAENQAEQNMDKKTC